MFPTQADVVIIGGGIVGCATARFLAQYNADVVLIDKATDLAMGTTKANSGIVHSGFDATPGSMKARMNVRGNQLYHELQEDLKYEVDFIGSIVVARGEEDNKTLEQLLEKGKTNGVPGLEIISREELLKREPNLSPEVTAGLYAPTAGVIWPFGAALAFAENAVRNGVQIFTETGVEGIKTENGKVVGVETNKGFIAAKIVVNAAGRWSDEISAMAGDESFEITPRRGEYILFDKSVAGMVNSVLFPTPSKTSKGILVSPTVHGNIFIGPNAQNISDKEDLGTTPDGLKEIIEGARRMVPNLPMGTAITQFVGLRPVATGDDFIIKASEKVSGLVQAAGIQSPGLASGPAIGEAVSEIVRDLLKLEKKASFNPANPARRVFTEMSEAEIKEALKDNPLYGRVICRCETVTEAEIVEAIHSPVGARTVDGVKRRTRAGMGRCQGGFCGPRVVAILARELNIPITEVRKETSESYLFFDKLAGECEVSSHE